MIFDSEVEQILDNQDKQEREITREDLIAAYWDLSEKLNRRPSTDDINKDGEFKIAKYIAIFGSWTNFLKEIGELTESSYHFPQGTHLGHICYILDTIYNGTLEQSRIAKQYVRFEKTADDKAALTTFQRQTKYKLQAAMEMGLIVDFRSDAMNGVSLVLTDLGAIFCSEFGDMLSKLDLSFKEGGKAEISWSMNCESSINGTILQYAQEKPSAKEFLDKVILSMDAINLLLKYLFSVVRNKSVQKSKVYTEFFQAPFVKAYCEMQGIDPPTDEAAKHRIPFLLNMLEVCGIIEQGRSDITVKHFVPAIGVMKINNTETDKEVQERINRYLANDLTEDDIEGLREIYGEKFYSQEYYLYN